MPTYRHKSTGKRFLFVHIPRTGGRFLESNLELNGWECEQDNIWEFIDGIEIAHFDRELYEKHHDVKDIPHISIIRNPIERFFSASIFLKRAYGDDIQEGSEDSLTFFSMIENLPLPGASQWWRPQSDFLSDKTHVWRFEDGLGPAFSEWMSDKLGVPFKTDAFVEYSIGIDEGITKLDKTPKLIDNVRTLCKKDIEQLYPELATPLQQGEKA